MGPPRNRPPQTVAAAPPPSVVDTQSTRTLRSVSRVLTDKADSDRWANIRRSSQRMASILQFKNKSPPMSPNKRRQSNRSPPVDVDIDDTTSATSVASTMTSISHRGQVNMTIEEDDDSDGDTSKKGAFLETIMKLEQDDKDGGDGGDSDEEGIEVNEHEEGMYEAMLERE